jgi:cob(I)alamin adenosyltransferase
MGGDDGYEQPLPPESPPPLVAAVTFAEKFQNKAAEVAEDFERIKNSIFGIQDELAEVEASTAREEDMAAVMKKEIEENIKDREAMVQRIELEFA